MALRIAETDLNFGGQREALMVRHFLAAVPRQRFIEFVWKLMSMLDKCTDHGLCIFSIDLCKHEVARLPLHQSCDLAILTAKQ